MTTPSRALRAGILVCPVNPEHRLSADAEPKMYYCYACAEHYHADQLAALPLKGE